MRTSNIALFLALAGLVFVTGSAQAAVMTIDFEDLGVAAGTQLNPPAGVSQDSGGFTFTPGPDNSSGFDDLHFHNEDGFGLNGTTNLGTHDDVVMTQVGGGAFDLLGFEFSGYIAEPEVVDVFAEFSGGGSMLFSFFPDTVASPVNPGLPAQPYDMFAGGPLIADVVSLTWRVGDNYGFNGFFLDNIVVNTREAPEPGTMSVLGLGLLALAGLRRKRS